MEILKIVEDLYQVVKYMNCYKKILIFYFTLKSIILYGNIKKEIIFERND